MDRPLVARQGVNVLLLGREHLPQVEVGLGEAIVELETLPQEALGLRQQTLPGFYRPCFVKRLPIRGRHLHGLLIGLQSRGVLALPFENLSQAQVRPATPA